MDDTTADETFAARTFREMADALGGSRPRRETDASDPAVPVAATIVMLRDSAGGPEVLLIERPDRGSFAGAWVFPGGKLQASDAAGLPDSDGGKVTLGFRPEALDVVPVGTPGSFDVEVNLVEELGSDAFVYGTLKGDAADVNLTAGETNQLIVRIDPRTVPDKGDVIAVSIQAGHSHVFSATTGERLG